MGKKSDKLVIIKKTKEDPLTLTGAEFDKSAKKLLTESQYTDMVKYIKTGGHELSLATGQKFFELFLRGEHLDEISRLNPTFPASSIYWMAIKYKWHEMKDNHIMALQKQAADKVLKAQLEVASFYSDMLSVTVKKHGDKLKKYLQTGNEKDLEGVLKVETLHQLMKTAEALQKITGQDKNVKIKKEEKLDINVSMDSSSLDEETSAKILSLIAEEKRKKNQET